MSNPMVRKCLPNSTTRGRPTYPRPITATTLIWRPPSYQKELLFACPCAQQQSVDGRVVVGHKRLQHSLGACGPVSYTHLRAHETDSYLVCRLLLEKKKK